MRGGADPHASLTAELCPLPRTESSLTDPEYYNMDFASVARAAKANVVAARGSGARAAPSLPPARVAPNQSSIDLALSKGRGKAEPTEPDAQKLLLAYETMVCRARCMHGPCCYAAAAVGSCCGGVVGARWRCFCRARIPYQSRR
jgi:hypothetical protein